MSWSISPARNVCGCWHRTASGGWRSLGDGAPLIRPVNYVFDDRSQSVVFRTGRGSKFHALLRSANAAFEIDGIDERARTGWSVVMRGVTDEVVGTDRDPAAGRPGPRTVGAGGKAALDVHPCLDRVRPAQSSSGRRGQDLRPSRDPWSGSTSPPSKPASSSARAWPPESYPHQPETVEVTRDAYTPGCSSPVIASSSRAGPQVSRAREARRGQQLAGLAVERRSKRPSGISRTGGVAGAPRQPSARSRLRCA